MQFSRDAIQPTAFTKYKSYFSDFRVALFAWLSNVKLLVYHSNPFLPYPAFPGLHQYFATSSHYKSVCQLLGHFATYSAMKFFSFFPPVIYDPSIQTIQNLN